MGAYAPYLLYMNFEQLSSSFFIKKFNYLDVQIMHHLTCEIKVDQNIYNLLRNFQVGHYRYTYSSQILLVSHIWYFVGMPLQRL